MAHYAQPYYGYNQNLQHGLFDTCGPTSTGAQPAQPAVVDNRDIRTYYQDQISPSQQIAMRNSNLGLMYDMDTGSVRTEKRHDPYGAAILARLDSISSELATTVKRVDIVDMVKNSDLKTLQDRVDAQALEIQELRTHLLQQGKVNKLSETIDANAAGILNLGQQSADLKAQIDVDKQSRQYAGPNRPDSAHPDMGPTPKHLNIIIEGVLEGEDPYDYVVLLAQELGFTLYRRDIVFTTRLKRRDFERWETATSISWFQPCLSAE